MTNEKFTKRSDLDRTGLCGISGGFGIKPDRNSHDHQLAGSVDRTGRLDGALHYFHVSAGIFPVLADLADGAEGETDMDLSYGYRTFLRLVCDLYGRRVFRQSDRTIPDDDCQCDNWRDHGQSGGRNDHGYESVGGDPVRCDPGADHGRTDFSQIGSGPAVAMSVSALVFGLAHGNFYQFFYAFLLGLIFAYIYLRTGKVRYSMMLHMMVNFCGSVIPILLMRVADENEVAAILASVTQLTFMGVFMLGGLILFICKWKEIKTYVHGNTVRGWRRCLITSPGMILLYVCCVVLFFL